MMTATSDVGAHAFNDPGALWREIQATALEAFHTQPLGAGVIVTKSVAAGVTVVGLPASAR